MPQSIDEIYEQFMRALRRSEQPVAGGLAHSLGLSMVANTPWSQVFLNDVVRALPSFFAEALPAATDDLLHDAVTAHALGIIAAFAIDRIHDGQLENPSHELLRVVNELRRARDSALDRLGPGPCAPHFDYGVGEWALFAVATAEQRFFSQGVPTDFATYQNIAVAKQYAAYPATLRLAFAAGISQEKLNLVRDCITGLAVALQLGDDVCDWQEDLARGGAWAAILAPAEQGARADVEALRRRTLSSGILSQMVVRAAEAFAGAHRAAEELGAIGLTRWIEDERRNYLEYAERERASPGGMRRCLIERRLQRMGLPAEAISQTASS